jgi:predicted PurR-regulated permease PerM
MAVFSGKSRFSWLFAIWVIVGIVIAWGHSYITVYLVKLVLSALLAILLWPLVLLGISLHVH